MGFCAVSYQQMKFGVGKTFEAVSVKSRKKRFRVLITAEPAIRSKWEWKEEIKKSKWCD